MNIPPEQRAALLRFAEFESKQFDGKEDVDLMMLQVAWFKFAERNPTRFACIMRAALELYAPEGQKVPHG
jgi:hypothetical protein